MDDAARGRRVQIARIWAGYADRDKFAPRLEEFGISAATLGRIERGDRPAKLMELQTIAQVTGVPLDFLVDEAVTTLGAKSQIDRIEDLVSQIPDGMEILRGLTEEGNLRRLAEVLQAPDPASPRSSEPDEPRRATP